MRNPEVIVQLMDIEKKLWTNDPEFYHSALREDAMLVFGETGVIGRKFAVEAIRKEQADDHVWEDVAMDDMRHSWVNDDVVIITYRSAARWKNETITHHALASSVYHNTTDGWKLVFHQQSPISSDFTPVEKVEWS